MLQTLPTKFSEVWIPAKCDPRICAECKSKWGLEDTVCPKCDHPEHTGGDAEYRIVPLDDMVQFHCMTSGISQKLQTVKNKDAKGEEVVQELVKTMDVSKGTALAVRFALQGIKGVIDSDTGKPLELKFIMEKRWGTTYSILREDSFSKIARVPGLLTEIIDAVDASTDLTSEEYDEQGFTQESHSQTSDTVETAGAMKNPVHTTAEKGESPSTSES